MMAAMMATTSVGSPAISRSWSSDH